MRVALVTPRFPPDVGGLETYVGELAAHLHGEPACEVTVITSGRSARMRRQDWRGIPVLRLGTWATLSNTPVNPLWAVQLRRALTDLRVDVVNAHAPVPGLADLALLTSPAPVVLTYHAGSMVKGDHPADPLLRRYEQHLLPRLFERAAGLIAVSPVSLAHATGRAELIPPGVDTRAFRPPERAGGREPRVLYVGRVERSSRWKGVHVLVEAFARLLAEVPEAVLDIAGDGDDVAVLRARVDELGIGASVCWHGAVDHHRLPELYRQAAVTVLPSLTDAESFGMVLVEAMASGCPVVGSDVGGIPFVIRDGVDGLVVPAGDVAALTAAVRSVLQDPVRAARLGSAGREAALDRWDWAHHHDRTTTVLRKAAHAS